jgi:predicted nucleotidyltransferase
MTSEAETRHILRELQRALQRELGDQLEDILLFGSRARGEGRPDSDVDVLILLKGEFDYGELIRRTSLLVAELSLRHDVVISRAFATKARYETEQSPFYMNVRREAVPI